MLGWKRIVEQDAGGGSEPSHFTRIRQEERKPILDSGKITKAEALLERWLLELKAGSK